MVAQKRIEFVGGWVQHDEATTSYDDIVANMMVGASYIRKEFGIDAIPHLGWQLDVAGHSSANAKLFADMGLQAQVISRVHYYTKIEQFEAEKKMDFVWQPDFGQGDGAYPPSNSSSLFTHIMYDDRFSLPKEFLPRFDKHFKYANMGSFRYMKLSLKNVSNYATKLVEYAKVHADVYGSSQVPLFFGDTFSFEAGSHSFLLAESIMDEIRSIDPEFKVVYSTPTEYFLAVA